MGTSITLHHLKVTFLTPNNVVAQEISAGQVKYIQPWFWFPCTETKQPTTPCPTTGWPLSAKGNVRQRALVGKRKPTQKKTWSLCRQIKHTQSTTPQPQQPVGFVGKRKCGQRALVGKRKQLKRKLRSLSATFLKKCLCQQRRDQLALSKLMR